MTKSKSIMGAYHNLSKKDKFDIILSYIGKETLEFCSEQNYSTGMVRDMIMRDYPEAKEDKRIVRAISVLQTFRTIMKRGGYTFCHKTYSKMPQSWKLQFRYPKGLTDEQIKEDCRNRSRKGQAITVSKRKENGSYENQPFEKKNSPLCMEFYLERGFSKEYAKKRIKSVCSIGARAALKKCQRPSTEKKVEEILQKNRINFTTQYVIHNNKGECYDRRKTFIYDFLLPESKTIIEVNGDFFHANPCYYGPKDLLLHPSGKILAEELWARDKRKTEYAEQLGYNVIVIWEKEIKNNIIRCEERILNG